MSVASLATPPYNAFPQAFFTTGRNAPLSSRGEWGPGSCAAPQPETSGGEHRGEERNAFAKRVADLEPELHAQAIRLAQGNQAKAARWLGVTRLKMRERLKELGLRPSPEDAARRS